MKEKAYCSKCDHMVEYSIETQEETNRHKGITFKVTVEKAICKECGNNVYIAGINNRNVDARIKAYEEAKKKYWEENLAARPVVEVSPIEAGILCIICGETIPYERNVIPFCRECRERAKAVLYPEKYGKV